MADLTVTAGSQGQMVLTNEDMDSLSKYVEECEAHLSNSDTYKAELNRCLTLPQPAPKWYQNPYIWMGISFLTMGLGFGLGKAL